MSELARWVYVTRNIGAIYGFCLPDEEHEDVIVFVPLEAELQNGNLYPHKLDGFNVTYKRIPKPERTS